jgi:cyclophilin family peptidyl-prolyl cis-trans isomerase
MRRLALQLWDSFRLRDPHGRTRKPARRPVNRRLEVEALELRAVPTAGIAGALTGTAFVDHNGTGIFSAGDPGLAGVTVTLSGTTSLGTSISTSTTTQANGSFQFLNVPKGTYQLSAGGISGYLGSSLTFGNVHGPQGVNVVSGVPVAPGHNLSAGVSVRGLAPDSIWLGQFLSTSTSADLPSGGTAGAGSAAASGPFVKTAISNVTLSNGGSSQTIDLLGHFSAPDLGTSMVRLHTALGTINLELFDQQAPQTVQNFIDYIESGKYANTIFHRRTNVTNDGLAVLQGGGFTFTAGSPATLPSVTAFPNVADEVGAANTPGTIAMAKGGSAGSANSQFFFNMSDNTNVLSPQNQTNGGFTVFGKIADAASQAVVNALYNFPIHNESSANSAMNEIPLKGFTDNDTNFPGTATATDFALITSAEVVSRNEKLTYTVKSDNTHAVTATLGTGDSERLTLAPVQIGTATITVTATDQFGQTASTTFKVTVGGTNTAPVVNSVTLSPTSPTAADTITATVTDSDPQNNPVTLTYVWQVTPAGSSTPTTVQTTSHVSSLTDTLSPSKFSALLQTGDNKITVTVTPNDGLLDGTPVVSTVDITV